MDLAKQTGLKYMMMETVVYAREFLYIKELYDKGELGKIQFLQASHQQDMDGWPNYWPGLPPMWYATHCVGPMLALTGADGRVRLLLRLGHHPQGTDREVRLAVRRRDRAHQVQGLRPDAPASTARSSTWRGSTARASTCTARRSSFEWTLVEHEPHVLHTRQAARAEDPASQSTAPDFAERLPKPIRRFTTKGVYDLAKQTHLSFTQGAGHGGSHPHLAHEFVTALVEGPRPVPERPAVGQLDLRGPVRAPVGAQGRRNREAAGVHAVEPAGTGM